MDTPHTLDLGRLRILKRIRDENSSQSTAKFNQLQDLESRRRSVSINLNNARNTLRHQSGGVEHRIDDAEGKRTLIQNSTRDGWASTVADLEATLRDLDREIEDLRIFREKGSENFQAADQLYVACMKFVEWLHG